MGVEGNFGRHWYQGKDRRIDICVAGKTNKLINKLATSCAEKNYSFTGFTPPPPPQKNCLSFRREREGQFKWKKTYLWKFWVKNKWTNSQNCFFYLKFCNKNNSTWPMAEQLVWGKTLGTRDGALIQDNQITSTKQLTSINLCWRIAEIKIDHFYWMIFTEKPQMTSFLSHSSRWTRLINKDSNVVWW